MATAMVFGRTGRVRRLVGPVLCLLIAAGAIARFTTAGHGGASRSVVARPVTPSDAAVAEATTALRIAVETGDPARYAVVDDALARAGEAPGAVAVRAALMLSRHEFIEARTFIASSLVATPTDRALLTASVDAAIETGHYDEAQDTLQRLSDVRPDGRVLSRISYLRELHGDIPGALAAMRQAEQATIDPGDRATVSTLLGDLCLANNDLVCAARSYDSAQQQRPAAANVVMGQARLLAARGDASQATALMVALVERSPQPAAASLLGELRTSAGDRAGAENEFLLVATSTALLTSAGVTTDLEAAAFEADRGQADRAVTLALAAYSNRHTVFTADTLGWALTRAGRGEEALPFVREANALGTTSVSVQVHTAAALAATGDAAGAQASLQQAFAGNPWSAPATRITAIDLARMLRVDVPVHWNTA